MKGAIFDVDGTLLDTMYFWHNLGKRYLQSQGKEPKENLTEVLLTLSLEEGIQYLIQEYDLKKDIREVQEGIQEEVLRFYEGEVKVKPGVYEYLDFLYDKKIPMVIVTSSERAALTKAFKRLKLDRYFKKIYTTSEENIGKEVPDLFKKACNFLREKPNDIWVFEDAHYAAKAAKEAGTFVVGISDDFCEVSKDEMKDTVDLYIQDFRDLMKGETYEKNSINHCRK